MTNLLLLLASGTGTAVVPPSTPSANVLAIQAAIDAAFDAGGGTVALIGTYEINATLHLKTGVYLVGAGEEASQIHLAASSNCNMLEGPPLGWQYGIHGISFDGHRETNTAGHGIVLDYTASVASGPLMWNATCANAIVSDVDVRYCAGNGFDIGGVVEARLEGCFSFGNGGRGYNFRGGSDRWLVNCRAGENVSHGFYIVGLGDRLIGCKSWWSGRYRSASARDTLVPTSMAGDGSASNYVLQGCTNTEVAVCESQDSSGSGWWFSACNAIKVSAKSDADGASSQSFGKAFYAQNVFASTFDLIVGTASSHGAPWGGVMASGFAFSADNNFVRNRVAVQVGNAGFVKAFGGNSTTLAENEVTIGTPGAMVPVTYAATITPDPTKGGISTPLTGNVTIANPVADRYIPGTEFAILLTEDATGGRTVAFGADYLGMTAATTTANKINLWTVRCVNGKWVQVGHVAY